MFKKTSITNRIIWIILAFFGWYIVLADLLVLLFEKLLHSVFRNPSNALVFVNTYYAPLLASCVLGKVAFISSPAGVVLSSIVLGVRASGTLLVSWL